MNRTILIFILVLVLIYINYSTEKFTTFGSFGNVDNIIIIVYDEQFYYLNIKNSQSDRYEVYRIPLYLIKNFFN
jgi:hypothetical protein